jgi:tetratricopeptide (TPR) repeat protein
VRGEDLGRALRLLRADEPLTVDEPERAWVLTMLLPSWCRSAYLRRAVARLPRGDVGDALRALVSEEPERAVRRLAAGFAGPERAWRDLAAGTVLASLGDEAGATAAATRALASRRVFVREEAWLLRGRLRLAGGHVQDALRAAVRAGKLDPQDARPPRLAADAQRVAGHEEQAARSLLAALRIAPESPRYAHALARVLREPSAHPRSAALWHDVDAVAARAAPAHPANAELTALRGMAAEHLGRVDEAVDLYRRALAAGAMPVPVDRRLRRLLVRRGDYAGAMTLLRRAVPPDVIADPRNRLRPRWRALFAAARAAPSSAAPAAARLALAEGLRGVGALEEAVAVARGLDDPRARDLVRRVQGHLAFERGLRTWIEAGYRAAARKEETPCFEDGLALMRRLARRTLAPDEQAAFAHPQRGARRLPLLGAWLDHGTDTTSPVVAHFRRYGRFLLYGQRGDGPPEAIVLSLASLTRSQPIRVAGRIWRHDVAVGYDRALRAQVTAQGGALGGACLADGIWLDADSSRKEESEVRAALGRDPGFTDVLAHSGALPADTLAGPTSLGDPGCAAGRLLARYVARKGADRWGSFGTLRAHEFGHVVDIRRHLPVLEKLPATVGLLLRHGFDFQSVQAELEMRAQLVACIEAPDPDLALAEMLLSLPVVSRSPEVHDAGYRDALGVMVRAISTHPERYPRIDVRARIVTQLDRLTNPQIRALARQALGR